MGGRDEGRREGGKKGGRRNGGREGGRKEGGKERGREGRKEGRREGGEAGRSSPGKPDWPVPEPTSAPGPAPAPPCTHLTVHGPELRVVPALGPVAVRGLAEARLHREAVIPLLVLTGTGVGDTGVVHELSVVRPVVEADPATALHLPGRPAACGHGPQAGRPPGRGGVSQDGGSDLPLSGTAPHPHQVLPKSPGSEFRFHFGFCEPHGEFKGAFRKHIP